MGRIKEFAGGAPHEVTERLFVVRRVFLSRRKPVLKEAAVQ
jgi:hypothetical protein